MKGIEGVKQTPGTEGRSTSGAKVGMAGMKQHTIVPATKDAPKVKVDKQGGGPSSGPKGS
jgi:hypothetical protein